MLITNLGPVPAFVVLGATATLATGIPVMPGDKLALTVSGGVLAAITESGNAALNVASGV